LTFALLSPKLRRTALSILADNGAWRPAGRALNEPTSNLSAKDAGLPLGDAALPLGDAAPPLATSYDEIPYPRLAFSYTHPSHLATVGRLLGLRPAPVDRCRVLELGCASGSNLAPMAYALPGSEWVGIDLSERQIADGRQFVAALGLTNVVLEQMDICEAAELLAARFEPFDYIIAHGIYSWVPDKVKDALLATCRRLLAPEGIAYVSYNCNPGGHLREIIRRICQYHGRNESAPRAFIAKIRGFLESLLQMLPDGNDPYRTALIEQSANLLAERDSVILHDVLERDNDSRLLHQFLAEAAGHGLQYLGDAHFSHMVGIGIDAAGLAAIRQDGDVVDFQQRLDFLYGRALRATLLCREEIALRHQPVPEAVRDLWIASGAAVVSPDGIKLAADQVDRTKIDDASPLKFRTDECTTTIANRIGKTAMLELCAAHPTPLRFDAFLDRVRLRLRASGNPSLADQIAQMAIRWFAIRLVELSAFDPPLADGLDARPIASAVARYQVENAWSAADPLPNEAGLPEGAADDRVAHHVTNLLHRRIYLGGELVAQVLMQLDGHHDRTTIVESLAAPVLRGEAAMHCDGKRITDAPAVRNILTDRVNACIADLARNALLVRDPRSA
jgi:SAM-dependent methyltransferase